MFSGLTSRWTMPAACAAPSARATWRPMSTRRRQRLRASSISARSVRPSMSSCTMKSSPAGVSPTSWMVTMLGWLRAEAARASRRKRWTMAACSRPRVAHQLDRDRPVQPGVEGAKDLAHAAAADARIDSVVPESGRCHPVGEGLQAREHYTSSRRRGCWGKVRFLNKRAGDASTGLDHPDRYVRKSPDLEPSNPNPSEGAS